MARIARCLTVLPNFSVHKMWRSHDKEFNLRTNEQKAKYLDFMNEDLESKKYEQGAELNVMTLMSSHEHGMFRIISQILFSKHMQRVHSRYGAFFNRLMGRRGKVAVDRPKTCLIADYQHELNAAHYIHANPVRAGIVKDAKDYFWSTYRLYAFGMRERWMRNIVFPAWYLNLAKNSLLRQRNYRRAYAAYLKRTENRKQHFLHKLFYGPVQWTCTMKKTLNEARDAKKDDQNTS